MHQKVAWDNKNTHNVRFMDSNRSQGRWDLPESVNQSANKIFQINIRGRILERFTGDLKLRWTFETQILPNSKNF